MSTDRFSEEFDRIEANIIDAEAEVDAHTSRLNTLLNLKDRLADGQVQVVNLALGVVRVSGRLDDALTRLDDSMEEMAELLDGAVG